MVCTVAMAVIAVAAVSTLTSCAGSITGSSTTIQDPQLQKLSITGALSYRARGNEPFWSLEIAGGTTTFKTPGGIPISAPTPRAETITGGRRFVATAGDQGLTATILDRPCVDDMSGLPYPDTVIVQAGGREYRGCGGDPEALLQGAEWVVKDVNGTGPIDNSRLTLAFGSGGRVSGHASCNTYTGQYAVTGEGTTVSKMATTRKLCAPSLMAQEDRFLDVLRNVSRFEISPDGALILHTGDGRTITARR